MAQLLVERHVTLECKDKLNENFVFFMSTRIESTNDRIWKFELRIDILNSKKVASQKNCWIN